MQKNKRLFQALGYQFSDAALLEQALSHRSVGRQNNERLEYLGDSLLNFIIAEALFQQFPEAREGQLSRLRSQLVKGETLADLAREFELGEYLLLGGGELKSGGHRRASILADVVEALIAAIYLESGMEVCRERTLAWFASRLSVLDLSSSTKDPKTRLQEHLQERRLALPNYRVTEAEGKSHVKEFVVACEVVDQPPTQARAGSKREAEKLAAQGMLEQMGVSK